MGDNIGANHFSDLIGKVRLSRTVENERSRYCTGRTESPVLQE